MKPSVFYPPKAHEKAITESLETVSKQDVKKEKAIQLSLPGFKKRQKGIQEDNHSSLKENIE